MIEVFSCDLFLILEAKEEWNLVVCLKDAQQQFWMYDVRGK